LDPVLFGDNTMNVALSEPVSNPGILKVPFLLLDTIDPFCGTGGLNSSA